MCQKGNCFSRGQPLGSLLPSSTMGLHQHPSVFRHLGKLWQDTLLDGQPVLTGPTVPLGLPVESLRAALISSAPHINTGETGMPAEPASQCQPLQSAVLAGEEHSGALTQGSPCFPEASPRMLTVPSSPGPHSCGTLGGGQLHGCGSVCGLGFGEDVTCPFPTCNQAYYCQLYMRVCFAGVWADVGVSSPPPVGSPCLILLA